MPGYTVETLAITGKWVPKDGIHKLQSLFSAAVETFEARLLGQRSRIVEWPKGLVVVTVPPRAIYVSPQEVYGYVRAAIKALDALD